jgi:EamA domain-containing membrane protein RarD
MQSTESPKVKFFWLSLGLLLRILTIVIRLSFPIYDHSRKHNSLFHINQFYETWYLSIMSISYLFALKLKNNPSQGK